MTGMLKWLAALLAAALIAAGGYVALLESGAFEMPRDQLEARYGTPASRFREVDGVRIHYQDEGPREAPVLVMLHASYMSLHSFDPIVPLLTERFRVLRFDYPHAGLSGPDPQMRLSMEHYMVLVDQLTRDLGIERFALFGTSSGGPIAFRYAADHPERVSRLLLVNSAGMPRTRVTNPNRPRGNALQRWIAQRHLSRGFWQDSVGNNFPSMPPPQWLLDMMYDMNRREGHRPESAAFFRNFRTGDPQAVLERLTMPTLIGWGVENATVMHLEADVMSLWMTNAPTRVIKYPGLGHYLYIEQPQLLADDIIAFLDGEMDGELRITRREPLTAAAAPAADPDAPQTPDDPPG